MRHYAGSALMLLVTTAVIVGSYTINLKVSAERAAVKEIERSLVVDARRIRDLQAELRTRARLPHMQRWNDDVLLMAAPAAGQYLRSPVQLAGFATQLPDAVTVTRAVTPPAPVVVPSLTAPVIRAAYRPIPAALPMQQPRVISAAYTVPIRTPVVDSGTIRQLATMHAPVELLPEGGQ